MAFTMGGGGGDCLLEDNLLVHVSVHLCYGFCASNGEVTGNFCPVWSVFAVRIRKAWALSYPVSAQRRLWSDWADIQADLSLRWAQSFCWFCHKAAQIMKRLRTHGGDSLPQRMDIYSCQMLYLSDNFPKHFIVHLNRIWNLGWPHLKRFWIIIP